jgi:cytochrome c oxidase assembly factor 2
VENEEGQISKIAEVLEQSSEEGESAVLPRMQGTKPKRECPVPKPGGLVGELFGFKPSEGDGKGSKPP